jgi:endogenous inhibitor of DNA gyrase (YacG/DUF329 family)
VKTVACPRCGAPTPYSPQNKWRPFCSERCKIIDLGAWAAESYRVPSEDQQLPDEEASSKPRGS